MSGINYNVEELWFKRDGMNIYGKFYAPNANPPYTTAVIAHGFGGNLTRNEYYAQKFAEDGIAACVFDFIGGGAGIKSDGATVEMSVLTEAADMNAVIDALLARGDVDDKSFFFMGCSQGGFVAAYTAAQRPRDAAGLILLYPAFVLQDDAKKRTDNLRNVPTVQYIRGVEIGAVYNIDALSFDIYDVIKKYAGNVLIVHGTADEIVPLSYSERAAKVYKNAELITIKGAGHGFQGADQAYAADLCVDFIKENIKKQ